MMARSAFVHLELLAGDLLVRGHDAFGLHIQADGHALGGADGLDHAADDLADLLFVVIGLHLALGLADALLDDLAGRLRGDAAEVLGRGLDHHHVAQNGFRVHGMGVLQRDLGALVLDVFDHFLLGVDGDLAGFRVDLGFDVLGVGSVDRPPVGRDHGRLDGRQDDLLGQLLFFQHFIESEGKFVLHVRTAPQNVWLLLHAEKWGSPTFR